MIMEEKKKKRTGKGDGHIWMERHRAEREMGAGRANVSIKPACGIMAESNRLRCVWGRKKKEKSESVCVRN